MSDIVLALDLGERMGVAWGPPGQPPQTGAITLKASRARQSEGFATLLDWARYWKEVAPTLIVKEGMIPLKGLQRLGTSEATIRWHYGLHAIIEAAAYKAGIKVHDINLDTVRVHFIGRRNCGSRDETKRAVIARAMMLGLLPREHAGDDDRADAVAVWDWACATLLRKPPKVLSLFGGKP